MRKVISGRRGTSRSAGSCVIRIIIPSQILWLLLKLLVNERRSKFETRSKWLRIRSRFATIFARSCRGWLASQSIGSPSLRPPFGLQEINRRDLEKSGEAPTVALFREKLANFSLSEEKRKAHSLKSAGSNPAPTTTRMSRIVRLLRTA